MEKKARCDLAAVFAGDPLRVVLGFFSHAHELRLVSKAFAIHAPCAVDVSSTDVRVPPRVTSLVCRGRQEGDTLPPTFAAYIGRDLLRLDLGRMAMESLDFLEGCGVLEELYIQGCTVKSGRVINCESLVKLDMFDTDFQLGRVPKLQDLSMQECPLNQFLPPSLTSLNCSYTHTKLCFVGLMLTRLDIAGISLTSLDFLGAMPLKELSLSSCTWIGNDSEPWPLSADLVPHCVKLAISHTKIYLVGTFGLLVLDMIECPAIEEVPDAPFLETLNCADNDLSQDFITELMRLKLKELNAAWWGDADDPYELDFSGLVTLEYLAVPDTCISGKPPCYGIPPNLRVIRFSEEDVAALDFEERVIGLRADTKIYVRSFAALDTEPPEESGMEGGWKLIPTLTLQELLAQRAITDDE
jgi:hypothetical protein